MEFRGATVEAALATARAAQGPDVTVLRALRVRRGVRGLLPGPGEVVLRVRVPVQASGVPGAPATRNGDPVDHALRALLARNDHLDVDPAAAAATPSPSRPPSAPVRDFVPESDIVVVETPDGGHGHRALEVAGAELERAPQPPPPAAGPGTRPGTAVEEPRWDVPAMHVAGLPLAVCRRLPDTDPGDHRARVAALAGAIAAVVPSPCPPGPTQAVALSGYGPQGALALIQAGASGVVPDRLHLDDGPVLATAYALALGVLACVPR